MDENKFWDIIELFDWEYEGDSKLFKPALDIMCDLSEAELNQFDEILAEKLYNLDTEQHARVTGFGRTHFSVDSFLYSRCYVVSHGDEFYEYVLKKPTAMPENLWMESILYLTSSAAVQKGIRDYHHITKVSYETFSNEDGWKDVYFPDGLPPGHKPKHQRGDG